MIFLNSFYNLNVEKNVSLVKNEVLTSILNYINIFTELPFLIAQTICGFQKLLIRKTGVPLIHLIYQTLKLRPHFVTPVQKVYVMHSVLLPGECHSRFLVLLLHRLVSLGFLEKVTAPVQNVLV